MKPPAFQFYADDFLSGTADMTAEEVGVYIRLLCHAWNKEGLDDNDRLALLAGQCQASSLAHAKSKFRLTDGKLKNDRQEQERQKQSEFRTRQAENGKKRWLGIAKPHAKPVAKPHATVKPPSPSPSIINKGADTIKSTYPIPDNLKTTEFETKWENWLEHLKQKRKTPTILAAEMQLNKLSKMGLERAMVALDHSITGNYQGIFEPNLPIRTNGQFQPAKRNWNDSDITKSL